MNDPICTMRVTTTRIRITVPGIPILTTIGIIPGGIAVTTILPGIMAVTTVTTVTTVMVTTVMVTTVMVTTVMVTTVAVTMVVVATTAVAITMLAESDLEPGDGELPTDDAIPDLGTDGEPGWKAIRKEIDLEDEYLVDKAGNIGAIREAGEMVDTEET